jgi:hypothetical protein
VNDWEGIRHAKLRRWFENWLPALTSPVSLPVAIRDGHGFAYLSTELGTGRIGKLLAELTDDTVMVLTSPHLATFWREEMERAGVAAFEIKSIFQAARWTETESNRYLEGVDALIIEPATAEQTVTARKTYKIANDFRGPVIAVAHFLLQDRMPPKEASTALRLLDWPRQFGTKVVWEPPVNVERLKEAGRELVGVEL